MGSKLSEARECLKSHRTSLLFRLRSVIRTVHRKVARFIIHSNTTRKTQVKSLRVHANYRSLLKKTINQPDNSSSIKLLLRPQELLVQVTLTSKTETVRLFVYVTFIESNAKDKRNSRVASQQLDQSPVKRVMSPFRTNIEAFEQKLDHDHLKSAITALNEKLKFYENIEQEKNIVKDQLDQSDLAREELRNNIRETAERIKEEKDKNFKYQEILINEN